MNSLRTQLCLAVAVLVFCGNARAESEDEPSGTVKVQWQGEWLKLDAAEQSELRAQALKIIESSNFNSTMEKWADMLDLQQYQKVMAGNYLTVTLPLPRLIKTYGNEIVVSKMIIGLGNSGSTMGLFTIDGTGNMAGHGKYSGMLCIKLLETVKRQVLK